LSSILVLSSQQKAKTLKQKLPDLKNYLPQGVCNVLKRIAGSCPSGDVRSDICYQDGEQLLCMDGLYKVVQNQTCLGAKYLVFVFSCSVKMREFSFLSVYTF
jgi:hypothetical protein